MPCTYYDPNERTINGDELTRLRNAEALLCGVFHVMEESDRLDSMMTRVDWKEVGLKSRWAYDWWKDHKKKDAVRKAKEAQERATDAARKAALGKLTPEERSILGLHEED